MQRATIHRFTPAGFEKRRAPPALFGLLRDYWERHNGTAVEERWDESSTFVNHEASRCGAPPPPPCLLSSISIIRCVCLV